MMRVVPVCDCWHALLPSFRPFIRTLNSAQVAPCLLPHLKSSEVLRLLTLAISPTQVTLIGFLLTYLTIPLSFTRSHDYNLLLRPRLPSLAAQSTSIRSTFTHRANASSYAVLPYSGMMAPSKRNLVTSDDEPVFFHGDKARPYGIFSQWHKCDFTDIKYPDVTFDCAEQYMM